MTQWLHRLWRIGTCVGKSKLLGLTYLSGFCDSVTFPSNMAESLVVPGDMKTEWEEGQ